jgi:hypothetical protein
MLENLLNNLGSFEITPTQIKIFVATFVAVTVMVGLQHMGVHSPIAILSLDK